MSIELPATIAAYFAADKQRDPDDVARCFGDHAVVKDEGHTYAGRDEIRRWKAASSSKYAYTVQPFAIAEQGPTTIVTSHLVGDFPGSPVDLRYFFVLEGAQIAALEIKP